GECDGFAEELQDDVEAPRTNGLAHTDLARAFRHAHQHDVHHANATDKQTNGRDRDRYHDDHTGDAIEVLDDGIGRGDGEVIVCPTLDMAQLAHGVADFFDCVGPLARLGFGGEEEI